MCYSVSKYRCHDRKGNSLHPARLHSLMDRIQSMPLLLDLMGWEETIKEIWSLQYFGSIQSFIDDNQYAEYT